MKKVLLGLSAYATANEADAAWLTVIETVVLFVSNKNDSVKGGATPPLHNPGGRQCRKHQLPGAPVINGSRPMMDAAATLLKR